MGKWAVIYSSVTGNTRTIAEAIAEQAGDADVFRVQEAPEDLSGYEVVALGYWLRLGQPDPLMLKYLPKVHDAQVVFFQTHGTAPTSEHAITSFARAGYNLGPGCTILGTFGCRGKINPAMLAKRKNAGPDDPHGGPKSMERWKLASTHPRRTRYRRCQGPRRPHEAQDGHARPLPGQEGRQDGRACQEESMRL